MEILLFVSGVLRAAALVLSVAMWIRVRNWRMGFLALLMGFLSYRKFVSFWKTWQESNWTLTFDWHEMATGLPGFGVSIMMLLAVIFLTQVLLQIERQREASRRSDELSRRLIEALPGGIVEVNERGRVVRCNPDAAAMLGLEEKTSGQYAVDEVVESAVRESGAACPPEDHPLNVCLRTAQAQPPVTLATRRANDEMTWAVFRAVPLLDRSGKRVSGAVLTLLDITARKRAEALIEGRSRVLELIAEGRELKEVLAALVATLEEQMPGAIASVLLMNQSGTSLHLATAPRLPAAFCTLMEDFLIGPMAGSCGTAAYTRQRVVDEDITHSARWAGSREQALAQDLRSCWSEPIFASNGDVLGTFAVYSRKVRGPTAGEIALLDGASHVAGIAIERHRTEETLRIIEGNLARTEAFALVIRTQINLDGSWRKMAPSLFDLVGYGEAELNRLRFAELVHPDDRDTVRALTGRLLSGELRTIDTEARLLRKDGFLVWVYLNASLVSDESGRPVCFLTYLRDVTQRKRAEQALREGEQRLKLAMRAAELGSWDWDIKRNRIDWSEEAEVMFGLQPRSFSGTFEAYAALVHPEDRAHVLAKVDQALKDLAEYHVEHRIFDQHGEVRWLETWGRTITDEQGEPTRMLGTMMDITVRKLAGLQLEQARQQLRALSHELLEVQETERRKVARELHEEIGQALAAVKTNLQSFHRISDPTTLHGRIRDSIDIADRVLQQVRALTLDLRPPLLDEMGLESALRWYVELQTQRGGLHSRFIAENLDVRFDSAVETACFRVAQEAINNVVRHARASKLTVELRRNDGWLLLAVHDDGRGFDVTAVREQAGQGRSVGVLRMEERVALVGGRLEYRSSLLQGTDVNAWFPLAPASQQKGRTSPATA